MSEKLFDYTTAITSRRILFCKLVKSVLIDRNIITSDESIANAVAQLNNDYFITNNEKNNKKIVLENNIIQKLLNQNPNMISKVLDNITD